MKNRREFLKQSGALVGGVALGSSLSAMSFRRALPQAGLQLYTIGRKLEEDLAGTLKRVSEIGYKNLESAGSRAGGFYGLKGKEFAARVKDLGMTWRSHHASGAPFKPRPGSNLNAGAMPPMKNLRENHQEIVDEVAEAGIPYLICAMTPIDTADEIKQSTDVLFKTGEACKKAGLIFGFHNHTKEFQLIDGLKPMDVFLTQIPQELLIFELDLAWATKAGVSPAELFSKNPGRFPLWHVKDLDKEQKPTEVGTGSIDFKPIFALAEEAGLKYYFVEQDAAPNPLVNIMNSFNNLKSMKVF
jgi:sugar phosphate isomerase/epimerase